MGPLYILHFSQCVVSMFGHITICKVTNLKVHSKGRYFVFKKSLYNNYNERLVWTTKLFSCICDITNCKSRLWKFEWLAGGENAWLSTAPLKIEPQCGCFYITVFLMETVSGYVCNHGSPSGERDTASPRGRYGERPQRDSVWRYIWKNTTCWPATAHDVTTGVPQYKCRREDTSSASSSEACVRSMAQSPGDAVSRSPLGEPWLHT